MNLVSTRPRVSRFEFYIALALVALAQRGIGLVSTTYYEARLLTASQT